MRKTRLSSANNLVNRFLAPSQSSSHEHLENSASSEDARPIWVHGVARSGTTSMLSIMANSMGRNGVFEPMHQGQTRELNLIDEFIQVQESMRSVPSEDRFDDYFIGQGVLSNFPSFGSELDELPEWKGFCRYLDFLYETFGRNSVFKEIRLFANLSGLHRYHVMRSIDWLFIGIICPPTRPMYAYYRRGWLSHRSLLANPSEIDMSHAYRVATFERLGQFPELTSLPAESLAEKFLVNCLLDQAELRRFVAEDPENRILSSLPEAAAALDWACRCTGESHSWNPSTGGRVPKSTHLVDPYFYRDVIKSINPTLREAMEDVWGPVQVDSMVSKRRFRRYVTSLRHRMLSD